jgi:hypothetical protein
VDQAPPASVEPAAGQPKAAPVVNNPNLNREFTQRSQAIAAIREELGLAPNSTPTEVAEAVRTLRAQAEARPSGEEDAMLNDPRVIELMRQKNQAEWTIAQAEYSDVAIAARDIETFISKKKPSPQALTAKVYEVLLRFAPPDEPAPAAAPAPAMGGQQAAPPTAGLGGSEGDRAPRPTDPTALDGFKGTGNVAGFLSRIGIGARSEG